MRTTDDKIIIKAAKGNNVVKVGGVDLLMTSSGSFSRGQSMELNNVMEDMKRNFERKRMVPDKVQKSMNERKGEAAKETDPEDEFDGSELSLNDRMFQEYKFEGEVVAAPERLTENSFGEKYGHDVELESGDKVFFHPNFIQETASLKMDDLYCESYDMVFAKRTSDGIKMIGDNCFCVPIMESEEEIKTKSGIWLKPLPGSKLMRAVLKHVGTPKKQHAWLFRDFHFEAGMEIIFSLNTDIPIEVDGEKLVRMKIEDIVAVYIHGFLVMQNLYIMVKPDAPEKMKGSILVPENLQKRPNHGEMLRCNMGAIKLGLKAGDKVWYNKTAEMPFEIEGKIYIFVDSNLCLCKE